MFNLVFASICIWFFSLAEIFCWRHHSHCQLPLRSGFQAKESGNNYHSGSYQIIVTLNDNTSIRVASDQNKKNFPSVPLVIAQSKLIDITKPRMVIMKGMCVNKTAKLGTSVAPFVHNVKRRKLGKLLGKKIYVGFSFECSLC